MLNLKLKLSLLLFCSIDALEGEFLPNLASLKLSTHKNICVVLIDLSKDYFDFVLSKSFLGNKSEDVFFEQYQDYVIEKLKNIHKLLVYCSSNNIPVINANYNFNTYSDYDIGFNLKTYNLGYTLSAGSFISVEGLCLKYHNALKIFNPGDYDQLYFCGMSIDACLLDTRYFSYNNIRHNNKNLLLDCSIQYFKQSRDIETGKLLPDGDGHMQGLDNRSTFKNLEQMHSYINRVLDFYN